MATTAEIQAQIAELNEAIGAPERQVTNGSRNVTYRSIDDLIKARNDLAAQLAAATATQPRPKRFYGVFAGRGFD
jgi:hypothetical protein